MRERDEHDVLVPVLLGQLVEMGDAGDAGCAPGRPELDDYHLTFQVGPLETKHVISDGASRGRHASPRAPAGSRFFCCATTHGRLNRVRRIDSFVKIGKS